MLATRLAAAARSQTLRKLVAQVAASCVARRALPVLSTLVVWTEVEVETHPAPGLLAVLGFAGLVAAVISPDVNPPLLCMEDDDARPGYIVHEEIRKKYGIYPPWRRLNVDQVPLPFVNNMDSTYEVKGAKRVTINQGGPSLSKRQATGQLCFRPAIPPIAGCTSAEARAAYKKHLQEQPAPCILFRGMGQVTALEQAAYPKGLVVLWQESAWVDRPLAMEWAEDVIKPFIKAELRAGVAGATDRYLLFQDNLDSQKQPEYIEFLKKWAVDDHKVPPNETDQVQPIDRGLGRQVKVYMGQQMDAWMEDDENMEKWETTEKGKGLTASDRRILLGTWFYQATKRALEGDAKRKYFEHAGALMTADGTDDDLIKLEGTPKGYKLTIPKQDNL